MNKPILFNTEMVQAILEGRKTVTRRIVKKRYENTDIELLRDIGTLIERQNDTPAPEKFTDEDGVAWYKHTVAVCSECNPPYQTGDVLWVRETWQRATDMNSNEDFIEGTERYLYAASDTPTFNTWVNQDGSVSDRMPWHPSIHMPREAARIFLRVTDVRAKRLREMTVEDIEREGLYCDAPYTKDHYAYAPGMMLHWQRLWNSTIKPADLDRYGWNANPWVWVISFDRTEKPEDFA